MLCTTRGCPGTQDAACLMNTLGAGFSFMTKHTRSRGLVQHSRRTHDKAESKGLNVPPATRSSFPPLLRWRILRVLHSTCQFLISADKVMLKLKLRPTLNSRVIPTPAGILSQRSVCLKETEHADTWCIFNKMQQDKRTNGRGH